MDKLGGTHTNSLTSSETGLITLVESMLLAYVERITFRLQNITKQASEGEEQKCLVWRMGDGEANIKQFLHSWLGTNKYGQPS